MIKKILVRDYLKGYGDMSAEERKAFVGRVGEWLTSDGARLLAMTDRPMAKSQNLVTISTRWTVEDCRAMAEGISLMSAMVAVADTWLPTQIYMKSAYRAVRQVVSVLSEVNSEKGIVNNFLRPVGSKRPEVERLPPFKAGAREADARRDLQSRRGEYKDLKSDKTPASDKRIANTDTRSGRIANPPEQTEKPLPMIKTVAKEYDAATDTVRVQCAVAPARPKHIDQYVHLLPKATQERAAEYGELMRQLGEARDNMQLLMDDDHASAKSREQWAKQATRIDKQVRAIREELNREWEKVAASGRVVIDDLGMAHLVPMSQCDAAQNGDGTLADGDGGEREPVELTSEQKKRRRDLRKWLIDLRRGKEGKDREKRIELWRVNWQEYLTLEPMEKALEDEKILEAAKHFGIDLGGDAAEHGTENCDGKE
jgi:hypothetical protein